MFIEVKIDRKYIKQIEQSDIEKEITIAGWVEEIRQLGPITFLILKDSTGEIQLVAKKQNMSENFLLQGWRKECIGEPMLRLLKGEVGLKINQSGKVVLIPIE